MEVIRSYTQKNIINAYGFTPTLFYDVEGTLIENKDKSVKIEKSIGGKGIIYSLRVKKEIQGNIGELTLIDKDNILNMIIETEFDEKTRYENPEKAMESESRDSNEVSNAIEHLEKNQVIINQENLDMFFMLKKYLGEIIENIDFDSCVKLMEMGMDLTKDSLQKIADALVSIKGQKRDSIIANFIYPESKLNFKDAEVLARKIYGRKMGKDIYESILALNREGIPITKDNIEKIKEAIDILHDLKDYNEELLSKFFKKDLPFNIRNLYRHKHSYDNKNLNKNIISPLYERFTIEKEEPLEYILSLLRDFGLESKDENICILREFLLNGVEITQENMHRLLSMRSDIKELIDILDHGKAACIMCEGINLLEEDIKTLIEKVKSIKYMESNINIKKPSSILKEIESLGVITDKELLLLIKNGEDFKIGNLKKIAFTQENQGQGLIGKVIEKTRVIMNIFNTLGELDSNAIAFSVKRFTNISLNSLYKSHKELDNQNVASMGSIPKAEEDLIRQEYQNIKTNTTLSLIKTSIKEGLDFEYLPLEELNQYIDKKVNRYREAQSLVNEIRYLKGKEDFLIPIIMKNKLAVTIDQIKGIAPAIGSGRGIDNKLNLFLGNKQNYDEALRDKIGLLEDGIRKFSNSIKNHRQTASEDMKQMIDAFKDLSNSSNFNHEGKEDIFHQFRDYLVLKNKKVNGNLILQLPTFIAGEYSNINLIIPNMNKRIQGDDMAFFVNIDVKNLGLVKFNVEVRGPKVLIEFNSDQNEGIKTNQYMLEDGLKKIGYDLAKLEINNAL